MHPNLIFMLHKSSLPSVSEQDTVFTVMDTVTALRHHLPVALAIPHWQANAGLR